MIADVTSSFGTTVTVVNSDESPEASRLDLALILEDLVGLDHSHGEFSSSAAVSTEIAEPEESVFAFASRGL